VIHGSGLANLAGLNHPPAGSRWVRTSATSPTFVACLCEAGAFDAVSQTPATIDGSYLLTLPRTGSGRLKARDSISQNWDINRVLI
jgi:hypothetical protein